MRHFITPLIAAATLILSTTGAAHADLGSGTAALVGAQNYDDNGSNSGSAYLFDISDPANPTQTAKLLPDDAAMGDNFGWSVAVSGTTAVVGAIWDDDNGTNTGSAYLFDATTGRSSRVTSAGPWRSAATSR